MAKSRCPPFRTWLIEVATLVAKSRYPPFRAAPGTARLPFRPPLPEDASVEGKDLLPMLVDGGIVLECQAPAWTGGGGALAGERAAVGESVACIDGLEPLQVLEA